MKIDEETKGKTLEYVHLLREQLKGNVEQDVNIQAAMNETINFLKRRLDPFFSHTWSQP